MNSIPRLLAVFPTITQVPVYLSRCRLVVSMMTGNPNFPNFTQPLVQTSAHLDTLEASQKAAKKGPDAVAQRNVDLAQVQTDMRLIKAHVQSVADSNINESEAIIKSAGLGIGKALVRNKAPVSVKWGDVPGRVVLDCKALPKPVQYRWQMSTDQKTWSDLPDTYKTKVIVDGLTPATVYYFRLRTMTHGGLSDWSVVVSIIAH